MRRILRLLAVLGLVAVVVAVVRRLMAGAGDPPAAYTPPPPTPAPPPTPVPEPAAVDVEETGPASMADAADTASDDDLVWVEPEADRSCPEGFPVKAKLSSKIFHVPGGLSYERTQADRCYRDEAAAEADGLRQAKR